MKIDKLNSLLGRSAIGASFGAFFAAFSLPGSENVLVVPLNFFFHAMFGAVLLLVGWRIWKIKLNGVVLAISTCLGATVAILLSITILTSGGRVSPPVNLLVAFTKLVSALLLWPFLMAIVSGYVGLRLNTRILNN